MSESGEGEEKEGKELEETFRKVEEMLQKARKEPQKNSKRPFLDVYGAIEIIEGSEQVSLFKAEKGDIAWWKTESGTTGYFRLEEPYKEGDQSRPYGSGDLMIVRKPGHPLGNQQGKGRILGAQFGSMLSIARIVKGLPLEYRLEVGGKAERYETTEVAEMGLIKAASLNQA